ncbi:hypothetical protein [Achromobacter spanius]|uniref:phage terminase large subunit family protein n=1 Tax=Achromobacter spanius TaxID=217203 RepID=UPI003A9152F7
MVDIAIDATGLGHGVSSFPRARKIIYSPEVKTRLVLKAQELIRAGRFLFDAGMNDIAAASMAIRKPVTASGNAVTYTAGRAKETSHADLAWACMHSLNYESLVGDSAGWTILEIKS